MRTLLILACLSLAASTANAQRQPSSFISHAPPATANLHLESSEPLAHLLSADCDLDRTRGREAAGATHSGTGWMAGGFVSGALLGLIGTAITWAMANSSAAQPDRTPDGVEPSCYRDGYSAKAKGINSSSALTGGLLGTALLVVLIVSASSGTTY